MSLCTFPSKIKYSKNEAKKKLGFLQAKGHSGIKFYKCPCGEHWHIGRKKDE